jgi:hypothetical protein
MSQVKRFLNQLQLLRSYTFSLVPDRRDAVSERNIFQVVHRYRLEKEIEFLPGSGIDRRPKGRFTILRLLNKTDGHERVVYENEFR